MPRAGRGGLTIDVSPLERDSDAELDPESMAKALTIVGSGLADAPRELLWTAPITRLHSHLEELAAIRRKATATDDRIADVRKIESMIAERARALTELHVQVSSEIAARDALSSQRSPIGPSSARRASTA